MRGQENWLKKRAASPPHHRQSCLRVLSVCIMYQVRDPMRKNGLDDGENCQQQIQKKAGVSRRI
jgi:hypothetical protein